MKIGLLNRWAVVGVVLAVLLINLQRATSQSQQRVQSTTQLSVRTAVAVDPMSDWEQAYAEAMAVAKELAAAGKVDHAKRLENDLEGLDQTLREYVRASERLRHKNRALSDTMQFLAQQNAVQMESRRFQTLTNASRAAHDVEMNSIRNTRR